LFENKDDRSENGLKARSAHPTETEKKSFHRPSISLDQT
jgi:hypothetical protein